MEKPKTKIILKMKTSRKTISLNKSGLIDSLVKKRNEIKDAAQHGKFFNTIF